MMVFVVVSSDSNRYSSRLQPYLGCMTRSPTRVDRRMWRLRSISTSFSVISRGCDVLVKFGGKLQPIPRKSFCAGSLIDHMAAERGHSCPLLAHAVLHRTARRTSDN